MFFFFKQKTAYVMRISDWSSDVCSSDLLGGSADRAVRRRVHPGVAALNHELLTRRELRNDACLAVGGIQGDDFARDRKSVVQGKSVSVRVDLGGRRIIKQKKRRADQSTLYNEYTRDSKINN